MPGKDIYMEYMEAFEITAVKRDKVVEANMDNASKRVTEFPSMFGSTRTVPSPDWAQYAASHSTRAARRKRASRGIF